ncbi:acetyltransferase [Amycolatopsis mediterranei S699]|uniref:Acetyltransferase n=2 Tax=Amycolatopsis mediterranei TaxID=33910 RepID=A0A0H3DBP8_AMYMU|nr:GNAT family N-acetyltransferase [Amycolatopsis mediterranei]ADJ47024.1 acetyltransferase [Amycolatopsis mediterranei U32]AEK43838.1 acetyltransferase [Amycolatopsis mediterranei S699]AFO78735.1 acetyltransferase [Amycolatopsis mediterranei S699]AGT85863.1 acetyltransferase [Amycolatopsis mediterranei RB]KDO04889.1 acetyltransferase [Amycolatopsis mediterranei]
MITIRTARADDEAALARLDERTWTPAVSPAPAPPPGTPFFDDGTRPEDVLVAEHGGAVAGYVRLGEGFGIPAHRHVAVIGGLAVDPERQRLGIARRLVDAAVAEARQRGARKVTLRVLGHNTGARRVYERCGFVVEGVLRGEFRIDGQDVDDILMARSLA